MLEFPRLPSGDLPPLEYRWVRAHGINSLHAWYRREAGQDVWPFARHQGRDEVAAYLLGKWFRRDKTNGVVVVIDFDLENTQPFILHQYASLIEWLVSVLRELPDWMDEKDLPEIQSAQKKPPA